MGEIKFAFIFNADCCAVLTGLLISLVLSTSDNPKFDFALEAKVAPVPPLAMANTPVILVALPVTLPVKFPITLPVIFPDTFPVTLPIKFPLNVFAEIVLPEKSPIGLLRTT